MPPPPAPWRTIFQSNLQKNTSSTSFSLTTIAYQTNPKTSTKTPIPRCRTVEFRGFFPKSASTLHPSALSALKDQNVGTNPDVYDSDMLAVTTDARMAKVPQLEHSDEAVEGVFWLQDVAAQWRVRGRAVTLGAPGSVRDEDPSVDAEEKQARGEVERGLRVVDGVGEQQRQGWEWERQITTYFANHSPVMRGSFKNPHPGTPRSQAPDSPDLKLNQKVEDLNDPVARRNFRVVVIVPEEMERLDYSNPEDARRVKWTLTERGWEETELWP